MTEILQDVVLVVDDTPETLGFVTQALEQAGVSVLVATSGEAALRICGRITPDVVLMDAVMPGLDGFETCRRIKDTPGLAHVPVMFMTGLSETEHVVHALDCGGVDFLSKPIDVDELQARIRVHLANARSVQAARVALDAAGRHLIAVSVTGAFLWSTPQTRQLLAAVTDPETAFAELAKPLARAVKADTVSGSPQPGRPLSMTIAPGHEVQLTFLGAVGADEFLFRLTAQTRPDAPSILAERFGLTVREADVLLWIAKGKANKDIGEILGLSPRTVNKHLEQIYVKLGVENRASAAVRAALLLNDFA
ncbi:DNA-binding response regulator [Roseibium sp. RKSG952]|uniref:response regulator transcription factor n=1 Tax=Roseibium sp. RKSG952 TaxID=2529384 RepID=UPI0012BB84DE|nr:DNA-binding response regulator [Roseibium sp. RKSG952]MTH99867.1 response regulator [Roseibium sp. RKSG952]